jgi:gluconolactonase
VYEIESDRPKGIQLSPDETILYVNNMNGEYLLAYDIQPDGTVRNRRPQGHPRSASKRDLFTARRACATRFSR